MEAHGPKPQFPYGRIVAFVKLVNRVKHKRKVIVCFENIFYNPSLRFLMYISINMMKRTIAPRIVNATNCGWFDNHATTKIISSAIAVILKKSKSKIVSPRFILIL